MATNVTFLLGAGASFEALPTIKTLTKEIGDLGIKLKGLSHEPFKNHSQVVKFANDLIWLHDTAKNHLTIDTLAKKMYLRGDLLNLEKLKRTLSLFFAYRQLSNKPLSNPLDKRYDGLLAALLERGGPSPNPRLPENVKILTWNYDCQIELTARDYFEQSFEDTVVNINSYPRNRYTEQDKLPSIVHLNGIAGYYKYKDSVKVLYDLPDRDLTTNDSEILDNILYCVENPTRNDINFSEIFTFSWEQTSIANKAIELASQIMEKTNILVVIGYSVPFFNRRVDKIIFFDKFINMGGAAKKIYFQNPGLNGSFLTSQFKINNQLIEHIEDCSQFYIPYEL